MGDMPCWLDDYSQFDADGFAFAEKYPGREGMLKYKCIHHIHFVEKKRRIFYAIFITP